MQLIINEIADSDSLPRIHSHKKINSRLPLSSHAKNTEEDTIQPAPVRQRSVSALQSNRKALHSANTSNTSKAVRLEVTTAAFQKKIEQLERQEAMLNKEIEAANAEIIKFRLKKKGAEESVSTSSSRASSAVAEDGRGRLEALRRRLDRERERARKIMNQVDKVRRDIQTTKKLNDQITQQLKSYESQLNSQKALAQELEETLAFKNAEAQKKKIEMVHQKARIIKEYDAILHKLDTQLNTQQTSKPTVAGFYLTDVALGEQRQRKRSLVLVQNSPKGHRAGNRIEYFREKMEEWRGQAEAIKGKVNAQSLQEVEEKLMEMHQNTYHYYKFINERRAVLEELQSRNTQLKQQKLCLSEEIAKKEHSRSSQAITTTKHNINKSFTAQAELKAKITECSQIYQKTRSFVCQLLHESGLQLPVQQSNIPIEQQINEATLATFLQSLLQMKQFGPNGLKYSHSL